MARNKPTAIDLFCGAGGLTLGLKQAGFRVLLGVEVNEEIAKTYKANNRIAKTLVKDVREVNGKEIFKLAGTNKIDLVAGCPPCQGFSQLTEKWKRQDPRNDLVLQMARLVEEIKPKMVMMENVPGIATKGKGVLQGFVKKLRRLGYVVNQGVLQMADYGVPQSRRRFVLLAGKGFEVELPEPTHALKPTKENGLKRWVPISKIIRRTAKPTTLSRALKHGGPQKFNWHVVRDLKPVSIERLLAVGTGQDRRSLPEHLRPECHKGTYQGFHNVYGRMDWDKVSPTITGGCTTPCKGRFGHPKETRTISVHEAALIQTFPTTHRFVTTYMDYACDLVGNALPPRFAKIAGNSCHKAFIASNGVKSA